MYLRSHSISWESLFCPCVEPAFFPKSNALSENVSTIQASVPSALLLTGNSPLSLKNPFPFQKTIISRKLFFIVGLKFNSLQLFPIGLVSPQKVFKVTLKAPLFQRALLLDSSWFFLLQDKSLQFIQQCAMYLVLRLFPSYSFFSEIIALGKLSC